MSGENWIAGWVYWVSAIAPPAAHVIFWLALCASYIVLWTFRRRVVRSLEVGPSVSPKPATASDLPGGASQKAESSKVAVLTPSMPPLSHWQTLGAQAATRRARLARLYLASGLALTCALALISVGAASVRSTVVRPGFLYTLICFSAPLVVTARVVYGQWNRLLPASLLAVLVVNATLSWVLGLGSEQTRTAIVFSVLVTLLLHARVRAMAPVALGFFTIVVLGAVCAGVAMFQPHIDKLRILIEQMIGPGIEGFAQRTAAAMASKDQRQIDDIAAPLVSTGMDIVRQFAIGACVALPLTILLGALFFVLLAKLYASKRTSDQWLVITSVWVFFASAVAPEGSPVALAASVGALAAFIALVRFAWSRLRERSVPNARLLLLRSFSLGERSGRLFQELESLWRGVGSIQLVAGQDLATATLEPHELLDFIRGRSGRYFTHNTSEVDRRIASFDYASDPDGRFRVNQIFCVGDATWQHAVQRLIGVADCVLMDVRGFSKHRAGCVFEIRSLAASALARIVFLTDASTDRDYVVQIWTEAIDAPSERDQASFAFVAEQDRAGSVCTRILDAFSHPNEPYEIARA